MRMKYATEVSSYIHEDPEWFQLITSATDLAGVHENLLIYNTKEDAVLAGEILGEAGLLEAVHPLLVIHDCQKGPLFRDWGFIPAETEEVHLFIESLSAFNMTGPDNKGLEMASLQLEEHLVCSMEEKGRTLYFIEHHNQELAKRISAAYGNEVIFLILDKSIKKI